MKIFNIYVGFLFLIASDASFIYAAKPKQGLSQWHNTIESADCTMQQDGSYVITLHCEKNPICYYMPHSFLESSDVNKKRYMLPRTNWSDKSMNDFVNSCKDQLKLLDVDYSMYKISGRDFGLGVFFEIDSSKYGIEKNIDDEYKTVQFTIKTK